ncbi:hypothetical protein SAMN05216452_1204 [Nitratireductor aquibiodomus]|uniref:Uncharacterized protein n=1 Tax=Nitratireductor aquibiodomus TaxID=204799 RepID=A0A1H4JB63_9HYPH|nr:hypothetical protein [Nitratireductor aquibiodomus]SEB43554.1 hypothetical protein SAMN05216452_1204 [Nitratireductor aquibiodomus]
MTVTIPWKIAAAQSGRRAADKLFEHDGRPSDARVKTVLQSICTGLAELMVEHGEEDAAIDVAAAAMADAFLERIVILETARILD